jgi:hypothetical protein
MSKLMRNLICGSSQGRGVQEKTDNPHIPSKESPARFNEKAVLELKRNVSFLRQSIILKILINCGECNIDEKSSDAL